MTSVTGKEVRFLISANNCLAKSGEPRASITTTLSWVMTKPALEMKLRLAELPKAAKPCTKNTSGCSWMGHTKHLSVVSADCVEGTHESPAHKATFNNPSNQLCRLNIMNQPKAR